MIEANEVVPLPIFHGANLRLAEHEREIWVATVPADVIYEHLLQPEFWTHVSFKLKPRAQIEVTREDGAWYAELIVVDAQRTWARVVPKTFVPLRVERSSEMIAAEGVQEAFSRHHVTHRGTRGWSVIRKSDNEVMAENIATQDDAHDWLTAWARKNPPVPPAAVVLERPQPVPGTQPGRGSE